LPLLELLTQLSRSLLVLLSSQVVGLVGLEELGLWVKGFGYLIMPFSLDEVL
jgi:hypothetical protein